MQNATHTAAQSGLDYELVFRQMPGMMLILDPKLTIVAQNIEHARATLSGDRKVVGQNLFAAFADSPGHNAAESTSLLRDSLLRVLKTRQRDVMPVIRYDIKSQDGPYEVRWWAISNSPVLDGEGAVRWIINRAEDVTQAVKSGEGRR